MTVICSFFSLQVKMEVNMDEHASEYGKIMNESRFSEAFYSYKG